MTEQNLHCWDFTGCPKKVCLECAVYKAKSDRCWEFTDTQCSRILGFSYSCEDCRYYQAKVLKKATDTAEAAPGNSGPYAGDGAKNRGEPDVDR